MRPLSLEKGLLVPGFDMTEEELHTYKKCCRKGNKYAVVFGDRAALLYLEHNGPEVSTGFTGWVPTAEVADWEEVKPEPWQVAKMFGHGRIVKVPRWPEPEGKSHD